MEPVTMKPKRISFKQVSRTTPGQKRTIVITPGDGGPLNLKLEAVDSKFFEAELREIEKGKRYEIEVTLKTPLPAKTVRTNLKLETGLADAPHITILASAIPRPRVVAKPRRFKIPAKRKSDWSQAVHLEWDDKAPHKILSATSSDPGLKVKVIEKDGQQQVVLELAENYEPRSGASAVTIKTDDTEAPMVRVRVYVARNAASRAINRSRAKSPGKIETETKKIENRAAKTKRALRPRAKRPTPTSD